MPNANLNVLHTVLHSWHPWYLVCKYLIRFLAFSLFFMFFYVAFTKVKKKLG